MIVSPAAPVTPSIARLKAGQFGVTATLPERNEAFRLLVKKAGYTWDAARSCWSRRLDECSGPIPDRLLETAAALSNAGFVVEIDDALVERLRTGDWQPEHKRWVIAVGDKFGLRWRGNDENLYHRALMLPDSHWDHDRKAVTVPALYVGELLGFAEEHGFRFTDKARALADQATREYHRLVLPEAPAPVVAAPKKKAVKLFDPAKFADLKARNVSTLTALFPHQVPAVEKLLPLRVGALFMEMGTGKTRCAIEMAVRRQARISRVVWFCPVSLKLTIAAEIAKHTSGEAVYVFDDSPAVPDVFWYVVGIESMSSSDRVVLAVNSLVDSDAFVIVDESSYIKGHASKRSMRIAEISKRARYRLLLTGTPISQGVEDLYAQMRFLSPDILGYNSFYAFANNHLEYSEKYPGMIVRALDTGNLAEKIAPFVYQVTKAECLDLPEKLHDARYFPMTDEQRGGYERAKMEILLSVEDDDLTSYTIFKLFTALQQIVCGFWSREGETIVYPHDRLTVLQETIRSIPAGEKIIVWSKLVRSLDEIAAALSVEYGPQSVAQLHGRLSEAERAGEIERFRGDARFLIATQSTGGHGLTLNEAHHAIFYSNEFKYSNRVQAEDRCHRIGQESPVTYIDLVCSHSIDDRIMAALEKKQDAVKVFKRKIDAVKDKRKMLAEL